MKAEWCSWCGANHLLASDLPRLVLSADTLEAAEMLELLNLRPRRDVTAADVASALMESWRLRAGSRPAHRALDLVRRDVAASLSGDGER